MTYGSNEEAEAAIAGYDQQELDGRRIKVNMATERTGGGGGRGGGGGGYGLSPDSLLIAKCLYMLPG